MGRGALVLVMVGLCACRPKAPTRPEPYPHRLQPQLPQAQALIEAMNADDVEGVRAWMTPALRDRTRPRPLRTAMKRLRQRYGNVLGILEEHEHDEGVLHWYSGLALHGTQGGKGTKRPVLYQFALTPDGQLAHLVVREHWFPHEVRSPPRTYKPVTRFHFPAPGTWTVTQGGRSETDNKHHGSSGQRYAYDIIVRKNGRAARPRRGARRNQDYYAHGVQLYAPAAGVVIKAKDGVAENVPGRTGRAGGNGLVIDHGFGERSSLWHAIPGTVRFKVGDRVEAGQPVAKVGNSGRSTAPHIHFHVTLGRRGRHPMGLPAPFVDVLINGRWHERKMPVRDDEVRGGNQLPRGRRPTARTRRTLIEF